MINSSLIWVFSFQPYNYEHMFIMTDSELLVKTLKTMLHIILTMEIRLSVIISVFIALISFWIHSFNVRFRIACKNINISVFIYHSYIPIFVLNFISTMAIGLSVIATIPCVLHVISNIRNKLEANEMVYSITDHRFAVHWWSLHALYVTSALSSSHLLTL